MNKDEKLANLDIQDMYTSIPGTRTVDVVINEIINQKHQWIIQNKINMINAGRSSHTSTLLANGEVLIGGGSDFSGALNSAELYDSSSGTWALANSLNVGRWGHTASILTNGQVLVSGGSNGSSVMASAELFDPPTGIWTITGGLNVRRWDHTSSLLTNGKVLVAAGYDNVAGINDAELY
ncbi:unnamed protein product [Rotaria socialis]|uniref:Uncharacterized protein n=1 Tax=Rotaria socialis TaxID=392032 RepID=A0A817UVB2_9BILA|nr:unnamed protein product [Rotaria socialis]